MSDKRKAELLSMEERGGIADSRVCNRCYFLNAQTIQRLKQKLCAECVVNGRHMNFESSVAFEDNNRTNLGRAMQ